MELRSRQRFLDRAVHDLRASLRGIAVPAALLSEEAAGRFDQDSQARLQAILDGVARIEHLAKSLSDYSLSLIHEPSASLSLPLGNALQTARASLRDRIQETGATIHSDPLPRLAADHAQLGVLFRCLLSNALEYRDPAKLPVIEVTAAQSESGWLFAVRDNGVGIPPRYQQQIFEPFERLQSNTRGAGLGLAISKQIVEGHSGKIWVESTEGHGAAFFFTLPAHQLGE